MPYSAEAFRQMAMLLESLDSSKPALVIAGLRQLIEPLGARYFHITKRARRNAGGSAFVAVADTSPTLLMVDQLALRHPNFDKWGEQFLRDARTFDTDSAQIDDMPEEFQTMVDEQRQLGGAQYFISTPLFCGEECVGLSTHFFERKPDDVDEVKSLVNVLSQSAFDLIGHPLEVGASAPACPLTARQLEALQYCAVGKSDWDIGALMNVAQATAHDHIEAAKRRLGVKTRVQAVLAAYKSGWISV